jgi:hypothetical protein
LSSDLYERAFKINEMMVDFYDHLALEAASNDAE